MGIETGSGANNPHDPAQGWAEAYAAHPDGDSDLVAMEYSLRLDVSGLCPMPVVDQIITTDSELAEQVRQIVDAAHDEVERGDIDSTHYFKPKS